jgi:hypothetical protein
LQLSALRRSVGRMDNVGRSALGVHSLVVEPPYPSFEAVCPISSEVRHSSLRPVSLRRASLEPGMLAIVTLDGFGAYLRQCCLTGPRQLWCRVREEGSCQEDP